MLQDFFFLIIRRTSAKGSISFVMFIRLSARMEHLCSKWEDFPETFEEFLLKYLDRIQVWVKCNKTIIVFTCVISPGLGISTQSAGGTKCNMAPLGCDLHAG